MDDINVSSKRLDHMGVVAGTIRDLGIIEAIDTRIPTSKQEIISTGEATAAMILNGLGFTGEPLYMSPRFFADKPINQLFSRDDLVPENFNATKLGHSLDDLSDYGLENMFSELSIEACSKEGVDVKYKSLDTTSISLQGEYDNENDEQYVTVTHGFSKDKRSDLKQIVHELLVSQDGGIPLAAKSWSGNSSDIKIFRERANKLIAQFSKSDIDKADNNKEKIKNILVADSKLYAQQTIEKLNTCPFITRVPNSINLVNSKIEEALENDKWVALDKENKYTVFSLTHYGVEQRWIVVYSDSAHSRAKKRIAKKLKLEVDNIKTAIKEINRHKLQNLHAVKKLFKKAIKMLKFHTITYKIDSFNNKKNPAFYKITLISTAIETSKKENYIEINSCYIIGSNVSTEINDEKIISRYKAQNKSIENMGFRFIKGLGFFTSSLYVKTEKRIESLLFIMTLSLLVYSIAQRKLRLILEKEHSVLPDQLNKPTQTPTMRWIFKLLNGINVVKIQINKLTKTIFEGIDKLKSKIINMFGISVRKIYGFQT